MSDHPDILFIYPRTGWGAEAMRIAENDAPPLGLLYVASAARASGIKVQALDLNHTTLDDAGIAEFVTVMKPRVVALSVLTTSSVQAKRLITMIRSLFPAIILIAGGIHATVDPLDLLGAGVHYAVQGEGEATLLELIQAILNARPAADVPGLAYLDDHGARVSVSKQPSHWSHATPASFVETSKRDILMDLDTLPFPARDLVPIQDYGQAGAICSSRGCPYSCPFCSSVLARGHLYRLRSITKTIEEMDSIHAQFGIRRFHFLDDNFTADPDRAAGLARLLGERQYTWSCQTTIMELASRPEVLELMFAAGCREVYFGLETGSTRMMREYKGIELDQAMGVLTHAVSLTCSGMQSSIEERLQVVAGFIIGHPEDNEETVEETIQLALRLRRLGIDTMLSIMQPYPGSLLHKSPDRYGIRIEGSDYSEYLYPKANLSTRYLSRDRIRTLYASGLLRIMGTYEEMG